MRIACIVGTRPEAIKLTPVIRALLDAPARFQTVIVSSGQHPQQVASILAELGLHVDEALPDCSGLSLTAMTAALVANVGHAAALRRSDLAIVQGDTTTTFTAALAAFHRHIPVAHIEAGLRSGNDEMPFPEEAHRKLVAMLAELHFAPTGGARSNLRAMGIADDRIAVTGNTCVDMLQTCVAPPAIDRSIADATRGAGRLVLITLHRRESWGDALQGICDAVAEAVRRRPDVQVLFPLHPNPAVADMVRERLRDVPQIRLVAALPYREFIAYLRAADVVITDSGGVQEEAVTLGKQTLVVRSVTDRPEAVRTGVAELVGTSKRAVTAALDRALQQRSPEMSSAVYGDGRAAERIVVGLDRWRGGLRPLLPPELEFRPTTAREVGAAQ